MNSNLDAASLVLQVYNLILLMRDFNNTDLMQELQFQDEKYLKRIIEQNEKILELLKERK